MTTTNKIVTFEEYLKYDDGTDTRYELERGELITIGQGRGQHGEIIHFLKRSLTAEIERLGLNWVARQAAVGVRIPQVGRRDTSRVPDVMVLPLEQWKNLRNREAVIEREACTAVAHGGNPQDRAASPTDCRTLTVLPHHGAGATMPKGRQMPGSGNQKRSTGATMPQLTA
ncbi:MAG: Uma2 family endonuclease [Heteroscytonema crispum UTEX LB 1556]